MDPDPRQHVHMNVHHDVHELRSVLGCGRVRIRVLHECGALLQRAPELFAWTRARGLLCTVKCDPERGLVHIAPGSVLTRAQLMEELVCLNMLEAQIKCLVRYAVPDASHQMQSSREVCVGQTMELCEMHQGSPGVVLVRSRDIARETAATIFPYTAACGYVHIGSPCTLR